MNPFAILGLLLILVIVTAGCLLIGAVAASRTDYPELRRRDRR